MRAKVVLDEEVGILEYRICLSKAKEIFSLRDHIHKGLMMCCKQFLERDNINETKDVTS